MSWLEDLAGLGSSLFNSSAARGIAGSLASTAALGLILNQVNKSVNKENSVPEIAKTSQPDRFVREQLSPDTNHSIPVVYGSAFIKGIITDAVLTDNNGVMWYCITISEKTGTLLSNNADSVIKFNEIYLNQGRISFQADGFTVASTTSDDGIVDSSMNGLIKIYCYNNGSNSPILPDGYSNPSVLYATGLFPNWTNNHLMEGLVFALVRVQYSKEKNVTSLGEVEFKLTNTLSLPGDVLYDYMTNTRYGAGIPPTEIYSQ